MTIAEKLETIINIKSDIKGAIIEKGVDVTDTDSFASYADKIKSIETGTGGSGDGSSTIAGLSISDVFSVDDDGVLEKGTNTDITCTAKDIGEYVLNYAFYNCSNLTSVSFPSLTTISGSYGMNYAFRNSGLTSLSFPSLATISGRYGMYYAFSYCTNLTSVSFPNLTAISGSYGMYYAFNNCSNLTSLSFPSLTTISGGNGMDYAFSYCSNLTSASFPSLTTISGSYGMDYAFYNCSNLTSVSFPSLTTISGGNGMVSAFSSCSNLTSASFPNLTTISGSKGMSSTFSSCTNLKYLDLPSLSGTIYYNTFSSNNYLQAIWIPKEVDTIKAASSLTSTSYSASYSPFNGCTKLTIYTDAAERQEGWSDYWNAISSSAEVPVVYGCTHDEFLEIAESL